MGGKRNYGKPTPFAKAREDYNSTKDNPNERISQERLAQMLHTTKSTISRVENGITKPRPDIVQGYCKIFGVSAGFLVGSETQKEGEYNEKAYRQLGLSDSAVKTLQMINEQSSGALDISALLNAFLSGEENTVLFFQNLLSYLQTEDNDTSLSSLVFFDMFKDYLRQVVKPHAQTAIKKTQRMDEFISKIPVEIKYNED